VKKKSKVTKTLIAVSFLIGIIAFITPVLAAGSNRILFMAIGDDLDINGDDLAFIATNLITGKIESGGGDEPPTVKAVFHQRIYDESGKKVYAMTGMLKDGYLINTSFYFLCPIYGFWFINVSQVVGAGVFKTSDTDLGLTYRNWFDITMPNTKGKYVEAPMLMLLSTTAEYCVEDPSTYPPGEYPEVFILPGGPWVLVAALCDVGIPMDVGFGFGILPIGPVSSLTKYKAI